MQIIGKVISAATENGANNVNGARFVVDKPEIFREKARQAAIANAKAQAEKLSSELGIRLGKVVNIVESSPNNSYPIALQALDSMKAGGGVESPNIEPGSQTVTSTVTLYFEKK